MKVRSVKPLNKEELEKLSTERLLAYLKKLHRCEEDISQSDLSRQEVKQVEGVVFKSSPEWKSLYKDVKTVLATRPNVNKA